MRSAVLLFCGLLFFQPAFAQSAAHEPNGDILEFFQGLNLFYNNDRAGAEQAFREYQSKHPGAFVDLRLLYNGYVGRSEKLSSTERAKLLLAASDAIGRYESGSCHEDRLRAFFGSTIDCAYLGAALYSFRAALYAKEGSWHKAGNDRSRFIELADCSMAPQSFFLRGLAEYEVSLQSWPKRFAARLVGISSNRHDALALVMRSLDGNTGPFVDDTWFFVFNVEREYLRKKEKDHHHDDAIEELLDRYPFERVARYLASKYPENPSTKEPFS